MPNMSLALPLSGVGALLWEILDPPPVLVVLGTWLLDHHINFKVLSYLLYLHIFSREIKITMCKIYIAFQFL